MKRTILLGSVMIVLVFGVAAAQGRMSGPGFQGSDGWGFHGPGMGGPGYGYAGRDVEVEEVQRTGRLVLAENEFPAMTVGSVTYTLRIHPALIDEVNLRNGQEITVTGDLVEMKSPDLLTTYRVIHVATLESGGTKFVAPDDGIGGRWGARPYGGMHGRGYFGTDRPNGWNAPRR